MPSPEDFIAIGKAMQDHFAITGVSGCPQCMRPEPADHEGNQCCEPRFQIQ